MKSLISMLFIAVLMASGTAWSDTRVEQVWTCSLRDGKTMEENDAVNKEWLKFINGKVKGGGITSRIAMPVVGELGHFFFVDSFPDMAAWASAYTAMQTDKGKSLEAQFDALADCSSNRLYESRSS